MKKLVLLICLVVLFRPVLPVLEYAIDYEYIATVLCVNKAKPEMHCNGKCHLMKELAKAAEKENPVSSDKKGPHSETEILFFSPLQAFVFSGFIAHDSAESNFKYADLYDYLHAKSAFHPPTFIS